MNFCIIWGGFHVFKDFIYLFLLFLFIYLFLERGDGREKEEEKPQCTRDTSITCLSHAPRWGPGLQPRHVPRLGIKPGTFRFTGQHPIHWATPARAIVCFFNFSYSTKCVVVLICILIIAYRVEHLFLFLFAIWYHILFVFFIIDGKGGRKRGKHQCVVASGVPPTGGLIWPATQACALTGKWTSSPLVRRLALNPLSYTCQVWYHILLASRSFFSIFSNAGLLSRAYLSFCLRKP